MLKTEYAEESFQVVEGTQGHKVLKRDNSDSNIEFYDLEALPPGSKVIVHIPFPQAEKAPKEKTDPYPKKVKEVPISVIASDYVVFEEGSFRIPQRPVPVYLGRTEIGLAEDFSWDAENNSIVANLKLKGSLSSGSYFPSLITSVYKSKEQPVDVNDRRQGFVKHVSDFDVRGVSLSRDTLPHAPDAVQVK